MRQTHKRAYPVNNKRHNTARTTHVASTLTHYSVTVTTHNSTTHYTTTVYTTKYYTHTYTCVYTHNTAT